MTVIPHISPLDINCFKLNIPAQRYEQNKIAKTLSDMDTEITALETKRETQNRIVQLFTEPSFPDCLGYKYLGNLEDKADNSNIIEAKLRHYLINKAYSPEQINRALHL